MRQGMELLHLSFAWVAPFDSVFVFYFWLGTALIGIISYYTLFTMKLPTISWTSTSAPGQELENYFKALCFQIQHEVLG